MPEQFGFRAKHSTQHQLLRDVEFLSGTFNAKKLTAAIFLDIAKTFEKISHNVLIYKRIRLNLPSGFTVLPFMHFYLGNRNYYVSINNTLSALHFIICGIIQRSLLAVYSGDTTDYATVHHPYFLLKNLQHRRNLFIEWCHLCCKK